MIILAKQKIYKIFHLETKLSCKEHFDSTQII